jgi:hypothetical protein
MSQKDESPPGGLLSRVVRFVKSSSTSWNEGGADSGGDRESAYSKQMLKEMIERKRRNDFVRKREFDMLRKMRRSEVLAGQDPGMRPSFFQSSLPSRPDDRATTLKKIDEIEAQMSMQWWKSKQSQQPVNTGFAVSSHLPPDVVPAPAPPANSYSRTAPQNLAREDVPGADATEGPLLESVIPASLSHQSKVDSSRQFGDSPHAPLTQSGMAAHRAAPATQTPAPTVARTDSLPGVTSSLFSHSKQHAIQVEEFAHDPELEEAAIRFANGDDEGAEAGLLDVLGPKGSRVNHEDTWLALFDLYRAAGRQEHFDSAAIEFAGRFGRSAPQWFSMPELVGRMSRAAPLAPAGGVAADWTCPVQFGTQTVAALNAALNKAAQPWKLNWSKLGTIAEAAVEPLTKLFTQWAQQKIELRFIGPEALDKVLTAATPSGDRSVNPAWWKLRMEVLRVMHRPDEFELVALDYCVTYEVSPPSWEATRCDYKVMQPDGSLATRSTIVGEAFRDSVMSSVMGYPDSLMAGGNSQLASVATVELSGQILGDGKEAIALLDSRLGEADVMIVSCARLMRIDFTAAGTLLNWVNARVAEGRQVQFVDVHRLVAAFFNVIGISEHARIAIRNE